MANITIDQVLRSPPGEIAFNYPVDAKPSKIDKRYKTLRVERRGLRRWDCFEENPAYLQARLRKRGPYPDGWQPRVVAWQRYAASERMVQDLYALTLIHRVNIALDAAFEIPDELSIIGTPKYFPSLGTEHSRSEGEGETKIAPDWMVVEGDADQPPPLRDLHTKLVAWGDTKLKGKSSINNDRDRLPGTLKCPEAYLAQVVQYCIDSDIPFGFVITDHELVVFHLIKYDSGSEKRSTRGSRLEISGWQLLSSDATEETEFSSPLQRTTGDWFEFDSGDDEIPLINTDNRDAGPPQPMFQPGRGPLSLGPPHHIMTPQISAFQNQRQATPEIPSSSQQSSLHPESSPCPDPRVTADYSPTLSPHYEMSSQSGFSPDIRAEDPTHVLIKSYPADDEGVARRLFELCVLAKRAKDYGVARIGPWKLSFAALDALDI
ncbi:hypothetical protein DL768_001107 [Monosporascus sp. mg162]|nr:hypothetical protein DL768_001107 [Monosporascus sp. mg162]